jgi:hypothetical protein
MRLPLEDGHYHLPPLQTTAAEKSAPDGHASSGAPDQHGLREVGCSLGALLRPVAESVPHSCLPRRACRELRSTHRGDEHQGEQYQTHEAESNQH